MDDLERKKGRVAQSVAVALLESGGYHVARLGVEEVVSEVKRLDVERYARLHVPNQLRTLPDLLVTDRELSTAHLVEVKFRIRFDQNATRELHDRLERQMVAWPGTIAALFIAQSLWPQQRSIQNHLRIVTREKLNVLVDSSNSLQQRWERLETVHARFPGLPPADYHGQADRIADTIAGLAEG